MANRESEQEHTRLIRLVVEFLKQEGFKAIKADHLPEYKTRRPDPVGWTPLAPNEYIPDVTAETAFSRRIVEVETVDSISHPHTADQWRAFAAHARETRSQFIVAVPYEYRVPAQLRLDELGITAKILEL